MAVPVLLTSPVPETGQLVNVRQRRYVVTDVARSTLPEDPLRPRTGQAQHLVALNSVDDDGFGEELQVIWEIEPGASIFDPKTALPPPTGFDEPRRLDAFLDAVRWGAASTADTRTIQSPFRSGIEIEDYQLDPVVRAVQMPRANLLIADDVGLGKTIESGLVILELILRHRARTVLIVCPSSLQVQWKTQMQDKFGLDFVIVDSECLHDLRRKRGLNVNPWKHFPRLITSIDFLKRDRPLRLFRDALPPPGQPAFPRMFDILVVDEAHNIAPPGRTRIAVDSQRTAAIRLLAPHFEHKLFLSATPHNGYTDSFTALLALLDNQRFARGIHPPEAQLRAAMVRRLKTELPKDFDGRARFPERDIIAIEVGYTDDERRIHCALRRYTELRAENAADNVERCAAEFVLKLLKKRLFSSPAAFAGTLEAHVRSLESSRRKRALGAKLTQARLQRELDRTDEEFGDDREYEQATEDAVDVASRVFSSLGAEERNLLGTMRDWAGSARSRPDAKAHALIEWLRTNIKPDAGWTDRRVIIFTEYRDTQKWLYSLLTAHGFAEDERLTLLYGGMDADERERIKAAFQFDPAQSPVRILLATDAASEGIDLQNHCSRIIHYEIPWNPSRLEQRNGRVDRHGQRETTVLIHHFVGRGYQKETSGVTKPGELEGDLEFLMHAAIKVNRIREDLGKVGPVIAEQVEQAMLGRRQTLDTAQAERDAEPARRMLKFERNLRDQIARLHDQLRETQHEWRLDPENIQSVVETALALADQPPLIETTHPGIWPDSKNERKRCPVFRMPALRGSWAEATRGLEHPHTHERRPIVFDHRLAAKRDDVVLVHLNHRLVRLSMALLRAEVWSQEGNRALNRVTARVAPDAMLDKPAVVAFGRIVVIGARGDRLHEEVIQAGGMLVEGRFQRMPQNKLTAALDAATDREPQDAMKTRFAGLWPQISSQVRQALESRMRDRADSLKSALADRAADEQAKLKAIMTELDASIRRELNSPELVQLKLDLDNRELERQQLENNMDDLRARLLEIPGELKRETEAIDERYKDPQARLFPVAVTWLVPQKEANR